MVSNGTLTKHVGLTAINTIFQHAQPSKHRHNANNHVTTAVNSRKTWQEPTMTRIKIGERLGREEKKAVLFETSPRCALDAPWWNSAINLQCALLKVQPFKKNTHLGQVLNPLNAHREWTKGGQRLNTCMFRLNQKRLCVKDIFGKNKNSNTQ